MEIACACGCGTMIVGGRLKLGRPIRFAKNHHIGPITHGMAGTREYNVWASMQGRCFNVNDHAYSRYGGRGVTVCDRWRRFENFFADMGRRPAGMSIERIDNNGNYEPGNCKWATPLEQARNRRSVISITFKGETKNVSDWAKVVGVSKMTVHRRLAAGWPMETILSTPGNISLGKRIGRLVRARASKA